MVQHETFIIKKCKYVIKLSFEILKVLQIILRSPFYLLTTQYVIITTYYFLPNLIGREMSMDPMEYNIDQFVSNESDVDYDTAGQVGSSN